MKKKTAIDILMFTLIVLSLAFFLETQHAYWATLSAFSLGLLIALTIMTKEVIPVKIKADMIIKGENSFVTHMEAIQYCFKGYRIIGTYSKKRFKYFGRLMHYVELVLPKTHTNISMEELMNRHQKENDIFEFGKAAHENIFYHKQEPTDQELIDQQRFEELAERMKKRSHNKKF